MTPTETTTRLRTGASGPLNGYAEQRLRALERVALGQVALAPGQESGVVTGLRLAFTPTRVELDMVIPEGGLGIGVVAVGEVTADGFAWRTLNGVPEAAGYRFNFRLS